MLDFAHCMLEVVGVFFFFSKKKFVPYGDEFILHVFVDGTLLVWYDRLLLSGFPSTKIVFE